MGLSDGAGAAGWAGGVVRGPETNVSGPRTLLFFVLVFVCRGSANPSEIQGAVER